MLTLVPLPGVDAIKALRWILKGALRRHGMRCVDIGYGNETGPQPSNLVGKTPQPARE